MLVLLQMMNKEFGGSVKALDMREDGQYTIQVNVKSPLFKYVYTSTRYHMK